MTSEVFFYKPKIIYITIAKSSFTVKKSKVKNRTNHPISSNSHPSATENKAIHSLKRGGYKTNWNMDLLGVLTVLLWFLHLRL